MRRAARRGRSVGVKGYSQCEDPRDGGNRPGAWPNLDERSDMAESTEAVRFPPYSGDDATCVKCGFDSIDTKFVNVQCIEMGNGAHMTDRFPIGGKPHPEWEHLHRQCRRCGWSWDEAVAA